MGPDPGKSQIEGDREGFFFYKDGRLKASAVRTGFHFGQVEQSAREIMSYI